MSTSQGMHIRRVESVDETQIGALADLLIDCVDGGAGVSFVHPLSPAKAQAFWQRVASDVATGERALLVAEDDTGIVGTVQLVLDTNTGSDAERLYAVLGWVRVGVIPDFSVEPRGGLRPTTIFYKKL